ncbi:hypothetical protein G9A89_008080 [Geosiphon pyriformis]|nr:hypothetical protein G9A89_008080 [Geosiphon pyriformis]
MPELIQDILIQIFENLIGNYSFTFGRPRFRVLYPCLLVNRLWFHTTIIILYREPFIRRNTIGYKLVGTFISCLDQKTKKSLSQNGVTLPNFEGCSYLGYPSFLTNLHFDAMLKNIGEWCNIYCSASLPPPPPLPLEQAPFTMFSRFFQKSQKPSTAISEVVLKPEMNEEQMILVDALLTLFKQHDVKLRKLRVNFCQYQPVNFRNNMTLELILIEFVTESYHFSTVTIDGEGQTDSRETSIANLIRAQKNLRCLITIGMSNPCCNNIIEALSSQANSLSRIEFLCTNFKNSLPWNGLALCKQLSSITLGHCQNFDDSMAEPLFQTEFDKLEKILIGTPNNCPRLNEWGTKQLQRKASFL